MEEILTFRSFDGIHLQGDFRDAEGGHAKGLGIIIHGVHGSRDERGFHRRIAEDLSRCGLASFRCDWRCHGYDGDRPLSELTLAGVYNDIDAAISTAMTRVSNNIPLTLIAASFTGGVTMAWSRRNANLVERVILINPVIDYVDEYLSTCRDESGVQLMSDEVEALNSAGYVMTQRKPFSRAIINEAKAISTKPHFGIPYWILHGDIDTEVDIKTSKAAADVYNNVKLLVFPGAGHGFTAPNGTTDRGARTERNQEIARREIISILVANRSSGDLIPWNAPAG